MLATKPYSYQDGTLTPTCDNSFRLAIITKAKRIHYDLNSQYEGSSGLIQKKVTLNPKLLSLIISPPFNRISMSVHSSSSAQLRIQRHESIPSPLETNIPKSSSYHHYKAFDPHIDDRRIHPEPFSRYSKKRRTESIFTISFYARIEEFLDNQRLYIIDAKDYFYGNVSSYQTLTKELGSGTQDQSQPPDFVKSDCGSPKLVNDSIMGSELLQRRACRSQAPLKSIIAFGDDSPCLEKKRRVSRLDLKIKSPILEKESSRSYQISSRNSLFNTPMSIKNTPYATSYQTLGRHASSINSGSPLEQAPKTIYSSYEKILKKNVFRFQKEASSLI